MDCILAPFVSSRRSTPNFIKLAPICWGMLMRLSLPRNLISSINVGCSPGNRKGLKVHTNTANKSITCQKAASSKIELVICYLAEMNISHPTELVVHFVPILLQLQTGMSNFGPMRLQQVCTTHNNIFAASESQIHAMVYHEKFICC